jgi:hypothetical protein
MEAVEARRLLAAAAYYFSPAGNDLAAGNTPETAWKSASKLNSVDLNPNDQVYFEGGQTFASANLVFDANDAGTSADPVVIQSYGNGKATLNAGSAAAITASNVAGFVIKDLNFVGGWNAATQSGSTTNGILLKNTIAGGNKLQFVRIDNVDVSGFKSSGIEVLGTTGKSGFDDLRITNTSAHDNGDCGIDFDGYFDTSSTGYAHTNIYVGNCKAYNNEGIAGTASHTGSGIILSDVNGGTIERCVAWNNGARCTFSGGGPVGIWAWDSNAITIQYNESYANQTGSTSKDGGGFDLDGGVTNSVMQYNYSHDNDGAGYLVYQFVGARPFGNNTVRYNISENDGRDHAYASLYIGGGSAVVNNQIYGNTFYVTPSTNSGTAAVRIDGVGTGNKFRNNILYSTGGVRLIDSDAAYATGSVRFQGNNYFSGGGTFAIRWGGTSYSSLSNWRTASGQEKNGTASVGLSVDPQLVAAGAGGTIGDAALLHTLTAYQLLTTSPLIDAGMNLTSLGITTGGRDYYGAAVPAGGGFDIGAFEHVASYTGTAANDLIEFRQKTDGSTELFANASPTPTRVWAAGVYPTFSVAGGGGGNDTLRLTGVAGGSYTVSPTQIVRAAGDVLDYAGFDSLSLANATFAANADLTGLALAAENGATMNFNVSQHLDGLSIDNASRVNLSPGGAKVLVTPSIVVDGTLDLGDNDLVVNYSTVSPVGTWTGNAYDGVTGSMQSGRIMSSAATSNLYRLGVAEASQVLGGAGGMFGTESVDATAVLVKFTYAGDANLDGKLNIDDYTHIDQGIAAAKTGWFNGDFNLDGKINIDDYVLIDGAIANQGVVL